MVHGQPKFGRDASGDCKEYKFDAKGKKTGQRPATEKSITCWTYKKGHCIKCPGHVFMSKFNSRSWGKSCSAKKKKDPNCAYFHQMEHVGIKWTECVQAAVEN